MGKFSAHIGWRKLVGEANLVQRGLEPRPRQNIIGKHPAVVAKMRKQLKGVDREAYYDERTAMWDEAHEREAKAIRKLFDSMGGLYNKLAQDWV